MITVRTFIAFDTPGPIRDKMSELQAQLKKSGADVKWEKREKFHATIKFLGDVREDLLEAVLSKIESVARDFSETDVVYRDLGGFPNRKNPRVIWIGCGEDGSRLQNLKSRLDRELLQSGFKEENRPFHPHITLGRIRSDKGLQDLLPMLENLTFEPQKARISEILVMKSVLKPEGSEYSIIKKLQLIKT